MLEVSIHAAVVFLLSSNLEAAPGPQCLNCEDGGHVRGMATTVCFPFSLGGCFPPNVVLSQSCSTLDLSNGFDTGCKLSCMTRAAAESESCLKQ